MNNTKEYFTSQVVPLCLTTIIFGFFVAFLYVEILFLNRFTAMDIVRNVHLTDILVGMTIYLKTSVDFAIFIGNLMSKFRGWKNRIAIEIGTGAGNAAGTFMILFIWNFFRTVEWILAIMIFVAALVLLRLAEDGLEHAQAGNNQNMPKGFYVVVENFAKTLFFINKFSRRFLSFIIPNLSMKAENKNVKFWGLFAFAFSIPFILGLDDFAGYVPLFNVVNVFGFAIGVLAGHMILNIFLFLSPTKTISVVKNPIIAFLGSIAFVLLAFWGFWEVYKILFIH